MRFRTRTFLLSFVPFALLLTLSFWAIQVLAVSTVRNGLRASLRENQVAMARVHSKSELQNSRFLRVVGESAALKAGLTLLLAEPMSKGARFTIEDQLREISETLGFDFLLVSRPEGIPLAGIMRVGMQLVAMDVAAMQLPQRGFFTAGENTFQVTSVPINQGEENIGILSVGEVFDFSEFSTPAVLTRNGRVVRSSIPAMPLGEVESALRSCRPERECEIQLRDETYLSLPMESIYFGDGYLLRSLQSVDATSGPVQQILRNVFLLAGFGALAAAMILTALSSRSIVKPIATVVTHLEESEKTGILPEFRTDLSPIQEIRALGDSFNRAATSIREARDKLHRAYVEFVGSLASALDARDRYTAGHSRRVSEFACAIAERMRLSTKELDQLRIAALLHDIGKIGIADTVLQKPGKLTTEEFALIRQHPTIGRRILEGVQGFHDHLLTVELHHENWDGSGYPSGLRGDATPLGARIVHVADAYDAMTSDRPYRLGMSHEDAIRVLKQYAGTQFDPTIVEIFTNLEHIGRTRHVPAAVQEPELQSMQNLADAVGSDAASPVLRKLKSNDV